MGSCPRRKSASWTAPGAAPGGRSIPSPGSRKAAKPTAEAKPGIGSVTFTKPIPGLFICIRCTSLSLSVMINRPIIPVEPAPKDCFSILIREPLRHHTAVLSLDVHNTKKSRTILTRKISGENCPKFHKRLFFTGSTHRDSKKHVRRFYPRHCL